MSCSRAVLVRMPRAPRVDGAGRGLPPVCRVGRTGVRGRHRVDPGSGHRPAEYEATALPPVTASGGGPVGSTAEHQLRAAPTSDRGHLYAESEDH